jgi:hypothetical protein
MVKPPANANFHLMAMLNDTWGGPKLPGAQEHSHKAVSDA